METPFFCLYKLSSILLLTFLYFHISHMNDENKERIEKWINIINLPFDIDISPILKDPCLSLLSYMRKNERKKYESDISQWMVLEITFFWSDFLNPSIYYPLDLGDVCISINNMVLEIIIIGGISKTRAFAFKEKEKSENSCCAYRQVFLMIQQPQTRMGLRA